MIKKINKISNFGQYRSFTWQPSISDFAKFNVFYGWNGSGKSTLSSALDMLSSTANPIDFSSESIQITDMDGRTKTGPSQTDSIRQLYIFNQDFIEENIDWNNMAKTVIFVSKEKIEERKKLDSINKSVTDYEEKIVGSATKVEKVTKEIDSFLVKSSKAIKIKFKQIQTTDSKYFNYNKAKLRVFLESKTNPSLLTDDEIESKRKIASSEAMPTVNDVTPFDFKALKQVSVKIKEICAESIAAKSIEFLKENPPINNWVDDGLKIHTKDNSKICYFCGNPLAEDRINELNNHFSDQFTNLKAKIATIIKGIDSIVVYIDIPDSNSLFPDLKPKYIEASEEIKALLTRIVNAKKLLMKYANKKNDDPFNPFVVSCPDIEPIEKELQSIIDKINIQISTHNHRSSNIESERATAMKELESSFISEVLLNFDYSTKNVTLKAAETNSKKIQTELSKLNAKQRDIENSLSNEAIAATEFNHALSHFLGHSGIKMDFDPSVGGYRIKRTHDDSIAKKLSEGEKNAIALMYFAIKTRENDNDIRKNIVVIDDPVSSLDSNYTFHAYAFLKDHFEKIEQLFILTHNYSFFVLMHDWLNGKNKPNKNVKSCFYLVTAFDDNGLRTSTFCDADATILQYASEYHYSFERLIKLSQQTNLTTDEWMLAGNLSRKCLECFASFKRPKARSNFKELLSLLITNEQKCNRVYKFINHFSHLQKISFDKTQVDMLVAEGPQVLREVINVIYENDETHCRELFEVANHDIDSWLS